MAKRRGHGEGSIVERTIKGNRYFQTSISLPDGKRLTKYFKTKKEAKDWLLDVRGQQKAGTLPTGKQVTVQEYFDHWLEVVVKPSVRIRAYERYKQLVRLHLYPSFGKTKLQQLRAEHLQALYAECLKSVATGTILNLHRVIHNALDQAVKWNLVGRNVADAAEPPRPIRKPSHPLTNDEIKRLLSVIPTDRLYALWMLAIVTGMRRGELLALQWEDVDWENATIAVHRSLQCSQTYGRRFEKTKTDASTRQVVVPEFMLGILREHKAQQEKVKEKANTHWEENGLVFPNIFGRPAMPSEVTKHFKRLVRAAGLPDDIRLHDLRHTTATVLL